MDEHDIPGTLRLLYHSVKQPLMAVVQILFILPFLLYQTIDIGQIVKYSC